MPSQFALAVLTTRLSKIDLAIVALYLIGITLFGLRFREKKTPGIRQDRSLKSYFLANNTIPWWAIALSIVSAETSTLTIISIPGVAFAGDFGFLQIVLGYMLGRIVVALLFLPRYFAGDMLTAYQLIDQRFGPVLHKVTAGLFLLTRAAAEGVRVFAVSIVVGIAIGTGDTLSIGIISLLTLLYTFEGGMAAVIWTDVVQMVIYVGGTFVAIWSLGHHISADRSAIAGWQHIIAIATPAHKFHMFNFAMNLTTTYTFWAGILGGTFLTMASHGTDQLMVQRMLAARSLRESRLALLSSGVVIFMQFALFLLIGVGLYVFYGNSGAGAPFMAQSHRDMNGIAHSLPATLSPDRIFPTFIVHELPIGIAGLLVAAILAAAMSNLSAALNSLSSTTVVDFYMRLRPNADDRERNLISKSSTVLWAIVLFAIAIYSLSVGGKGHVVEIGLSIASVAYGCLLGVFLLGTLTRFATETGTAIGMLCGFIVNIALWQFPGRVLLSGWLYTPAANQSWAHPPAIIAIPKIAFTWYVILGALVTFAIGAIASLIFRKQSKRTPATIAALLLGSVILSGASRPCVLHAQAPSLGAPFMAQSHRDMGGVAQTPDFSQISTLLNDAITNHHLPGAVVVIGHNNKIVFEHAYGNRKLPNEPGLTGQPSPAEPMTEDTIFDMASLTKCLATATAVMQLYDAGKITSFDDPISKYLPAFLNNPDGNLGTPNPAHSKGQRPDSYQPGAKPQVSAQNELQRAEGPTHNPATDPRRALVTIRMLLTHTSGEAPDVDLKDPWGLATPDRAEGFRRALTTPLKATPGSTFTYSDINFILLGDLVETLSGQREDDYAREHIFLPLGMTHTRYLPADMACGIFGYAPQSAKPDKHGKIAVEVLSDPCTPQMWARQDWLRNTAPTAHDNEGTAATNPDFDHLLRGTVHDPTTRRMGGVAGHAGVFSTAHDISLYAQALLDKLLHNTGPFPVKQSTLQLMTQPEQPSHTPPGGPSIPLHGMGGVQPSPELRAANEAQTASIQAGDKPSAPGLAPHYPAIKDQNLRGFGWDIDTAFSKPRGAVFPIGSFGHTGFTGTSLWMDPPSNTYVILLANAIHPRGNPPISNLRGQLATAAAQALGLSPTLSTQLPTDVSSRPEARALRRSGEIPALALPTPGTTPQTLTGIDVLEATNFAPLNAALTQNCPNSKLVTRQNPPTSTCHHHLGLLTNQTGRDKDGHRTIDILYSLLPTPYSLTTLFSPEHGINGTLDKEGITSTTDAATGLPVISLYGKPADRHPTHAQLKDLDAVLIDLQDAGVHFWTYEAAAGYFLEAAAREESDFHHHMEVIVLDRPNPVGGLAVQGPVSDPGSESYVNYMPLPVRHGLTLGELLHYANATKHLNASLTVIPMQHWSRSQFYADTGLPWVDPSPNLRSPEAALRYPALGLIEFANLSVGRGTDHPFSFFGAGIQSPGVKANTNSPSGPFTRSSLRVSGEPQPPEAPWFHATEVAAALTARHIPGATFTPTTEPIAEDVDHYPYHGQTIEAVRLTLTDTTLADTPEIGIEILSVLNHLYPTRFQLAREKYLLCNQATLDALTRGDDPRTIAATWQPALDAFRAATKPYLLY